MNKTKFKRILRIAIISIILFPFLFLAHGMYKTFYMSGIESYNLEDYISGRYLSWPGGYEVVGCIPAYEELGDYESIRFGYFDGRRKNNFFHKYYITFAIQVQYSKEAYLEKKRQADVTNNRNDYTGEIQGYKFVEKGCLNYVVYGAEYNDKLNTIMYAAICGDNGEAIQEGWLWILYAWNNPF